MNRQREQRFLVRLASRGSEIEINHHDDNFRLAKNVADRSCLVCLLYLYARGGSQACVATWPQNRRHACRTLPGRHTSPATVDSVDSDACLTDHLDRRYGDFVSKGNQRLTTSSSRQPCGQASFAPLALLFGKLTFQRWQTKPRCGMPRRSVLETFRSSPGASNGPSE